MPMYLIDISSKKIYLIIWIQQLQFIKVFLTITPYHTIVCSAKMMPRVRSVFSRMNKSAVALRRHKQKCGWALPRLALSLEVLETGEGRSQYLDLNLFPKPLFELVLQHSRELISDQKSYNTGTLDQMKGCRVWRFIRMSAKLHKKLKANSLWLLKQKQTRTEAQYEDHHQQFKLWE